MLTWLIISIASIVTVVLAFAGIWRVAPTVRHSSEEISLTLYEARISEIDSEFELGQIDAEAREAAKAEQARNLIRSAESGRDSEAISRKTAFSVIVASMILVPVCSGILYFQLGSPDFIEPVSTTAESPSLEELVAAAEIRLIENPDDARGWRVLAPVYMRTGQFGAAAEAYRNLLRLEGEDPSVMAAMGEALFMQNGGQLSQESLELFKAVSRLEPDNNNARFFIALGEFEDGNLKAAGDIWQDMLDSSEGNEPWLPVVQQQLAELNSRNQSLEALSSEEMEQVNQMVSGLAERLQEDPDDKEGWERLIRSYIVLDRVDSAKEALGKVREHFPSDGELLSRLENMLSEATKTEITQ